MKPRALALLGFSLLAASLAWPDVQPRYGSMKLPLSTVHVVCKDVNDNILVVGACDTLSDSTALHLEEDCEITAEGQSIPSQWEGHDIIVVNHPVPSHFVSSQTLNLDSEGSLSGLVAHFLVHVSANADGSFTSTINTLSLQCQS